MKNLKYPGNPANSEKIIFTRALGFIASVYLLFSLKNVIFEHFSLKLFPYFRMLQFFKMIFFHFFIQPITFLIDLIFEIVRRIAAYFFRRPRARPPAVRRASHLPPPQHGQDNIATARAAGRVDIETGMTEQYPTEAEIMPYRLPEETSEHAHNIEAELGSSIIITNTCELDPPKKEELIQAIFNQDLDRLREYLATQRVDLNIHHQGQTLLNIACFLNSNNLGIIDLLLRHGANPLLTDQHWAQQNSFLVATSLGRLDLLERLLKNTPIDIDYINTAHPDGRTILMQACVSGHVDIVRYALYHGANPLLEDGSTFFKKNAVLLAIQQNHINILKLIIETRNLDINTKSSDGQYPLHIAISMNNPDMIAYILSLGADIRLKNFIQENSLEYALSTAIQISVTHRCPLNLQTIQLLLKNIKIESRHLFITELINYAISISTLDNTQQIIEFLDFIKDNYDINIRNINMMIHTEFPPILQLFAKKNILLEDYLISHGLNLNPCLARGTLLQYIYESHGFDRLIQYVQKGADINQITRYHETTLMQLIRRNTLNHEDLKKFIQHGADINIINNQEQTTAFYYAVIANNPKIARTLLELGIQISSLELSLCRIHEAHHPNTEMKAILSQIVCAHQPTNKNSMRGSKFK